MIIAFFYTNFLLLLAFTTADDGTARISGGSCRTPDKDSGFCIPIKDCQPMMEALEKAPKPITSQVKNYLKKFQCGFENTGPKVCCPNGPITFVKNEKSSKFPDISNHRNFGFLPKDCGILDTDDKIFGGTETGLFEFPWMALLSYRTKKGPQFKCGGSIINNRYILTAAHCLSNLKQTPLIGVRVGEHNIKTTKDCEYNEWDGETCAPNFQDLKVEQIIPHADYDPKTFSNDIGLIKVSPIDLTLENSRPVCLPLAESRNYNFTGRMLVVSGWGVTEKGVPSSVLLKVAVPLVPAEKCQELYNKFTNLDHRQICAGGERDKDSCSGDSGGPLHVIGRINGEDHLIQQGVVSFGPLDCAKANIPGVYTRVAAFMDWILDNMEE